MTTFPRFRSVLDQLPKKEKSGRNLQANPHTCMPATEETMELQVLRGATLLKRARQEKKTGIACFW